MSYAFLPHWTDVLPREPGHVVAVSGAGGKSEWIAAAVAALAAAGAPARPVGRGEDPDAAADAVLFVELGAAAGAPVRPPASPPDPWPRRTSLAVVVQGLSALGRPAGEVLPGAGAEPWSWDDAFASLSAELARVPRGIPVLAALLQLDGCDDSLGLFAFLGRIMTEARVPVITVGDTSGPAPRLRTAYREEPPDGAAAGES